MIRYYLNLPVPPELSARVSLFERKWQGSAKSDPHITLVIPRLLQPNKTEAELIRKLENALAKVPVFPIRLTGLGHFSDKRVIHIGIERTQEFGRCHEAAMQAITDLLEPPNGEHADISHPHITLAARLTPANSEKAWQEARTQEWSGDFLCDRVQLLRLTPRDPRWSIVAIFPLCVADGS